MYRLQLDGLAVIESGCGYFVVAIGPTVSEIRDVKYVLNRCCVAIITLFQFTHKIKKFILWRSAQLLRPGFDVDPTTMRHLVSF